MIGIKNWLSARRRGARVCRERECGARIGPYRVVDLIGTGGQGVVYAARHVSGGEVVALKVVPIAWAAVPELRERLRREAAALARVAHPNVIRLLDVGALGAHAGEGVYLAMERHASSLDRTLSEGRLTAERAVAVARGVLAGLAALHGAGLLHRDVKPANVLLRADGTPVLTDLGMAVEAGAAASAGLTPWNLVVGTAEYLAPERIAGAPADVRSDLYALGVTLYEMLAGRAPFRGSRPSGILRAQRVAHPPALPGDVPPSLCALVDRALRKRPEERFASAEEMSAALVGA